MVNPCSEDTVYTVFSALEWGKFGEPLIAQSEALTIQLAPKLKDKLDALAQSTRRSKS